MLQKLSYFNLIAAIVYLLTYLRNGTLGSTAGILMVIVFNWLCLRSYQLDNYSWKAGHYLTGLWSLYFVSTLLYGSVNIMNSLTEYDFISNDTIFYLSISFIFCTVVIAHFILYLFRSFR
ncbi:MAG: hypothetical protein V4541_06320 [Bacteroidota bacterium]